MAALSNDAFYSLGILAEVASATLSNECSAQFSNYCSQNLKIGINKKSNHSTEKLTLDKIKTLSEKQLIDMFSELTSDEIRKNYSFQCFLIPEKCSQIFKSFGSEARARCQMKMHLQDHINDLTEESKNHINDIFTAEPLHIRKKRLQELNAKNGRKRRKSKKLIPKEKNYSLINFNGISSSPPVNEQPSPYSSNSETIQSINYVADRHLNISYQMNFSQLENNFSNPSEVQSTDMIKEYANVIYDFNESNESPIKTYSGRKAKQSSSSQSDSLTKSGEKLHNTCDNLNTVDSYTNQNSSNSDSSFYQDHDYTSIDGKTYIYDIECTNASVKAKKHKKPQKRKHVPGYKTLPSLPFPFVYVPVLPHAAEVLQIHTSKPKTFIHTNDSSENMLNRDLKANNFQHHQVDHNIRSKAPEQFCKKATSNSALYKSHPTKNTQAYNLQEKIKRNIANVSFNHGDSKARCSSNMQSIEKELALHYIEMIHTNGTRGPLICQICKYKVFAVQATLIKHYQSHAGLKPETLTTI